MTDVDVVKITKTVFSTIENEVPDELVHESNAVLTTKLFKCMMHKSMIRPIQSPCLRHVRTFSNQCHTLYRPTQSEL